VYSSKKNTTKGKTGVICHNNTLKESKLTDHFEYSLHISLKKTKDVCTDCWFVNESPSRRQYWCGKLSSVHLRCICRTDFCVPVATVSGRQHLRSATAGVLMVLRARTTTGQRSFAVNGPTVWKSLLATLRAP